MRPGLRRAEWLWAPALYALVTLVLYRQVWLGVDGRLRWLGWDTIESYWPDLVYLAGAVARGEWPLWNPYERGGYPVGADPQAGLHYPVNWLFVAAGAIAGTVPAWVIQSKMLAHHALAGLVLHAYLRSRRLHPAAAVLGGVAWVVSAPLIIHKASNIVWPLVWAPLVWMAIDRVVTGAGAPGGWRRGAALGGAFALAGLAGSPPGWFYVVLACVAYGGLRATQLVLAARRAARLRPALAGLASATGVAAAVAGALLAVVYLPVQALVAASPRAEGTLAFALSNPLPVDLTLVGLVAPTGGYVQTYGGALALALALTALIARPRADRWAPVFFVTGAAGLLVIGFGAATPVLPWLAEHVPGFALFREAGRYKLPATLLLAAASAHGLDALLSGEDRSRRRALAIGLAVVAALAGVAAVAQAWLGPRARDTAAGYGVTYLVLATGAAALVGAALARGRARVAGAAAVVAIAALDVATFGGRIMAATEAPPDHEEDRRLLAGLDGLEREWRLFDEFVLEQRPGSRLRVRDFRGYPSGDPLQDARFQAILRHARRRPQILQAFNVRWVLHGAHHRNGKHVNWLRVPPTMTAPAHFRPLGGPRYEALHPAPLVAWYASAILAPGVRQALAALDRRETAAAARAQVVIERADVPPALNAGVARLAAAPPVPAVPGRLVTYAPDRVIVEIDAPAAGVVVTNEAFDPGWRATVDGAPATPLRVDLLLRGVVVEPGRHVLEWRFAPPAYPWLAALHVLGLAFVAAAAIADRRASRALRSAERSA